MALLTLGDFRSEIFVAENALLSSLSVGDADGVEAGDEGDGDGVGVGW